MLHDLVTNGINIAAKRHFKLKTTPTTEHIQKFILRLDAYISFIGQIRGKQDPLYIKHKTKMDEYLKPKIKEREVSPKSS